MSLSQSYYGEINCVADDTTTAINVTRSWLFAIVAFLLQLKTGTTGTSGAPPVGAAWSTYYSCDGTTAGTANDGVNRWGTSFNSAKIVRAAAGTAHSWYVLKSGSSICAAVPSTPWYLIVDYGTAADTTVNLFLCKTAPTGGTTLARPTSVDEVGLTNFVMADVTAAATHRLNFVTDAVGNFYVTMARNAQGFLHTLFGVSQLVAPGLQAGDAAPMVIFADSVSTTRGAGSTSQFIGANGSTTATGMVARNFTNGGVPGSSVGNGLFIPGNSQFFTATSTNQGNSKTDTVPAQYYFVATGATAIRGTIPDWFLANSSQNVGNCEPTSGATEHVNYGNLWMPNAGVTPTL